MAPMTAWILTGRQWGILALMAAFYMLLCVRTALYMRHTGRNFWKWLAISLLLTSIPASIVAHLDRRRFLSAPRRSARGPTRQKGGGEDEGGRDGAAAEDAGEADEAGGAGGSAQGGGGAITCSRCGRRVDTAEIDRSGGLPICPRCGLPLDEERYA